MCANENRELKELLGCSPSADRLSSYLHALTCLASLDATSAPETKAYSDALYMNYFSLGLSLLFVARDGTKSITKDNLKGEELMLDSIDIYNTPKLDTGAPAKPSSTASAYSPHPASPITLTLMPSEDNSADERPSRLQLGPLAKGKDIVQTLGEPDRKGGGAGPSSGSIGIWCEWSKHGIMIEFGGDEARGTQAWERGKDAVWKVLTLFQPKAP